MTKIIVFRDDTGKEVLVYPAVGRELFVCILCAVAGGSLAVLVVLLGMERYAWAFVPSLALLLSVWFLGGVVKTPWFHIEKSFKDKEEDHGRS